MSTKSADHIWSIPFTLTFLLWKRTLRGLCSSCASRLVHFPTPPPSIILRSFAKVSLENISPNCCNTFSIVPPLENNCPTKIAYRPQTAVLRSCMTCVLVDILQSGKHLRRTVSSLVLCSSVPSVLDFVQSYRRPKRDPSPYKPSANGVLPLLDPILVKCCLCSPRKTDPFSDSATGRSCTPSKPILTFQCLVNIFVAQRNVHFYKIDFPSSIRLTFW